jgi:hypothetical protein
MKEKQPNIVVLGDLIGSRKIADRTAFEKKLKKVIAAIVETYEQEWVAPLAFEKGIDEIGAVVKDSVAVYNVVTEVNNAIAPQKIRFVAYRGTIDLGLKEKDITAMDGEAFHTAAAMMQQLKVSGMILQCNTGDPLFDKALENQLNAISILKENWTDRQREIFNLYEKVNNQAEVAKQLNITQQAISNALQQIDAFKIIQLEKNIREWLQAYKGKNA